jgi:hypothetical protein
MNDIKLPNNDNEFKDVINSLKKLKKVDAPPNFEADLFRKINQEKFEEKKSFWVRLLNPSVYIPSTVILATAVVVFFIILNKQNGTSQMPVLSAPDKNIIIENPKETKIEPAKKEKTISPQKVNGQPLLQMGAPTEIKEEPTKKSNDYDNMSGESESKEIQKTDEIKVKMLSVEPKIADSTAKKSKIDSLKVMPNK